MVLDPVVRGRPTDEIEGILGEKEQDRIADHVTVVVAGDELLGLVDGEVPDRVDAEVRQQLERIGTLDVHIGHVVRLVEQHGGFLPGALLVSPVREFGRYDGKDIGSDL